MATLIPALGTCVSRMTGGERRRCKRFSFRSMGIQVRGCATILKINCNNTRQILRTASLREEAFAIADPLCHAHSEGHAWGDMAIKYSPAADAIQIMTMKVSKGLEFPVVALPGVGHMPAKGEDEQKAARVFYVAATRATQRLVIGVGGDGGFGRSLSIGPATAPGLIATRD
jgi:hypothetical protein